MRPKNFKTNTGGLLAAFCLTTIWLTGWVTLTHAQSVPLKQEANNTFSFSLGQEQLTLKDFSLKNATAMPWSLTDSILVEVTNLVPPDVEQNEPYSVWLKVNGFLYLYTFVDHTAWIKVPSSLPNGRLEVASLDGMTIREASYWQMTSKAWGQWLMAVLAVMVMSALVWALRRFFSIRQALKQRQQAQKDSHQTGT